jgi:hypothetical protein
MEPRKEGPQAPWEVYCYHCKTTFPVGTRQCVHCGRRIGRETAPAVEPTIHPLDADAAEDEALLEPRLARRLGGLSLWVLLAIGAVVSRLCAGQ